MADPTTPLLTSLSAAARKAGETLLGAPVPPRVPGLAEFRRVFDRIDEATSSLLSGELAAIRPGAPIVDDFRVQLPETGEAWVLDAVDGAVQYLHGLPQWCVSVALVHDGQTVAAVLHNPVLGETYTAEAGQGATLNGRPLRPAETRELRIALVATSHPPFVHTQPEAATAAGAALAAVLPHVGGIRNLGPTSWQIADVAGGRLDGFWLFGRDPGNLLAAALIAREAGLAVTDVHGNEWTARSDSFLVAARVLHTPLRELLAAA